MKNQVTLEDATKKTTAGEEEKKDLAPDVKAAQVNGFPATWKAAQLTAFKDVHYDQIPYRLSFNNKRKIKVIAPNAGFEDLKAAAVESFPEIAKVRFPMDNMIFQYKKHPGNRDCSEIAYIENAQQWMSFCDPSQGPISAVKTHRVALKVVNKKSRKRPRDPNSGHEPSAKKQALANGTPGAAPTRQPVSKPRKQKGPKVNKPVAMTVAYQKANFRGALQEYFQKAPDGKGVTPMFDTQEKDVADINPNTKRGQKCYISTCKVMYKVQEFLGMGHAPSKKSSIQFSALDVILKMGLVTPQEHQAAHPAQQA